MQYIFSLSYQSSLLDTIIIPLTLEHLGNFPKITQLVQSQDLNPDVSDLKGFTLLAGESLPLRFIIVIFLQVSPFYYLSPFISNPKTPHSKKRLLSPFVYSMDMKSINTQLNASSTF